MVEKESPTKPGGESVADPGNIGGLYECGDMFDALQCMSMVGIVRFYSICLSYGM